MVEAWQRSNSEIMVALVKGKFPSRDDHPDLRARIEEFEQIRRLVEPRVRNANIVEEAPEKDKNGFQEWLGAFDILAKNPLVQSWLAKPAGSPPTPALPSTEANARNVGATGMLQEQMPRDEHDVIASDGKSDQAGTSEDDEDECDESEEHAQVPAEFVPLLEYLTAGERNTFVRLAAKLDLGTRQRLAQALAPTRARSKGPEGSGDRPRLRQS